MDLSVARFAQVKLGTDTHCLSRTYGRPEQARGAQLLALSGSVLDFSNASAARQPRGSNYRSKRNNVSVAEWRAPKRWQNVLNAG